MNLKYSLLSILLLAAFLIACSESPSEKKKYEEEKIAPPVPMGCDTTDIMYDQVADIINENCKLCHSSEIQSGGINLTDYDELRALADSGKLVASINHADGVKPMPPGRKMDECYIVQIESWVKAGCPRTP